MNATTPIAPLLRGLKLLTGPLAGTAAAPLALALMLALGSQFNEFPLGIQAGIAVLAVVWFLRRRQETGPLTGWRLWLAGLACALGVRWQYGYWFGQEPGVALVALLVWLKWLETRSERDERMVAALALFLLTAVFLRGQTPLHALAVFAGAGLVLLACARLTLSSFQRLPTDQPARDAARTMAWAIPLALLLFVLVPRVPGPLWGLPADARAGKTGLSETLEAGSIAQLARSDEIAFVVEVQEGELPAARYWRGPVLEVYDGRSWKPSPWRAPNPALEATQGPAQVRYRSLQEPSDLPWIFTLERTHGLSGAVEVERTSTGSWRARRPLLQRTRFTGEARFGEPLPEALTSTAIRTLTFLPPQANPRTREAGEAIAREHLQPEARLEAIADFFRKRQLRYTLTPPPVARDSADAVLFDTRAGFCEHFADAFAVMARAAGIPARIVLGYLGGERNPANGTWIIRQADAHSWVEVWLAPHGWVRVDPTTFAQPERAERGLGEVLLEREGLPLLLRPEWRWAWRLRAQLEAWEYGWNVWVAGFDAERQHRLWRSLGWRPDRALGWALAATGMALALAALLAWWLQRPPTSRDPLERQWHRFCRLMARRGLARAPAEGPLDYGRRLMRHFPQASGEIEALLRPYLQARYGGGLATEEAAAAMRRALHQLRRRLRQEKSA